MKIRFKQRNWLENLGLVFLLCFKNFIPLFLVMAACSLPYFLIYWATDGNRTLHYGPGLLLGPTINSDWSLLGLIIRPIRQAFCLYIVARCFDGVRVPSMGGLRHCLHCLPALLAYSLVANLGLILIMAPGCFMGFVTMNSFVFFVASGIPFIWMFSGLSLGPSAVVVEGPGGMSAIAESFFLAHRRRLYLLSFLGVLFLPTLAGSLLQWIQPQLTWDQGTRGWIDEPAYALVLRGVNAIVLDMPATIGPAILYFQLKARAHEVPAAELARLVDQIGERHDVTGD